MVGVDVDVIKEYILEKRGASTGEVILIKMALFERTTMVLLNTLKHTDKK